MILVWAFPLISLFSPILGILIYPAAFIRFFFLAQKFFYTRSYLILIFAFVCFLAFKLAYSDLSVSSLNLVRFFWGVIVLTFLLKELSCSVRLLLGIFLSFCLLIVLETMLINFLSVDPVLLPTFPQDKFEAWSHFAEQGNYQRPYSLGRNATVSATCLLSLFIVLFHSIKSLFRQRLVVTISLLFVLAFVCIASGTAYVLASVVLVLLLFQRLRHLAISRRRSIKPINLLFFAPLLFLCFSSSTSILDKISLDQLYLLVQFKVNQIQHNFSSLTFSDLLVGKHFTLPNLLDYLTGDFALLDFFAFNGLIGLLFLFTFLYIFVRSSCSPLSSFLLLLGSLHYGVIFYLFGQICFAFSVNYDLSALSSPSRFRLYFNRPQ